MSDNIRISEEARKFYESTAVKIFELVNSITSLLREALVLQTMCKGNFLTNLETQLNELKKMKNIAIPLKNVEDTIKKHFSKKMERGYYTARKYIFGIKLVSKSIEESKMDEKLREIYSISQLKIPNRLKDYLIQSSICYFAGLYESSITMIGRATEFILKEFFRKNKIPFNDESTLGELIKKYEESTHKDKKVLKHIIEVNKIDRNISSHDNPRKMDKIDADHMRTAIKVILKDLLNVKLELIIE